MLHVNRYGPKLSEPPADMNPETHVFLEGRVYSRHSAKLPASPDEIERATLTELHASGVGLISVDIRRRHAQIRAQTERGAGGAGGKVAECLAEVDDETRSDDYIIDHEHFTLIPYSLPSLL